MVMPGDDELGAMSADVGTTSLLARLAAAGGAVGAPCVWTGEDVPETDGVAPAAETDASALVVERNLDLCTRARSSVRGP